MSSNSIDKNDLRKSKELEDEVVRLRQIATLLMDQNDWYQIIFNSCPMGIIIIDEEINLLDANDAFLKLVNLESIDEAKEQSFGQFVHETDFQKFKNLITRELPQKGNVKLETELKINRGRSKSVIITAFVSVKDHTNPSKIAAFIEDNANRIEFTKALAEKDEVINNLKMDLKEQAATLDIYLEQASKSKQDLEDSVIMNIREIIFPYLQKIKKTELNAVQIEGLDTIKKHLDDIISPFYRKLTSQYSNLTPMETRIAGLVKAGKTTKEMANLLNLSAGTVEFHRNNLRKKLGIRNTNIKLRSYLVAID